MGSWLAENAEVINAVLNALMVLIWTAYLQIFLVNHLRQARSVIHIDIGAAKGVRSRCLVTNLSSNPIYVQGLVADLTYDGRTSRSVITDRDEISEEDVDNPLSRTNRGVLMPGQTQDIGSLTDLLHRAQIRLEENWAPDQVDQMKITVVAISGQVERIVGASKTFIAQGDSDFVRFSSNRVLTKQIRANRVHDAFGDLLQDQSNH